MKMKYSEVRLLVVCAVAIGCVAGSVQAVTITMDDANYGRLLDNSNPRDGVGDSTTLHNLVVGTKANSTGQAYHGGIVFQMTGITDGTLLTYADFSISLTGGQGTPIYNVDVYANRVASTDDLVASDFEVGTKLMDDFVTTSDIGNFVNYSLDSTGQANLLTYLQNNWVEGDYVFITLKANTDPSFIMGEDADANYNFGGAPTWTAEAADAQLSVSTRKILVFSENFNGQTITHTDTGPVEFGGASPEVAVGQWFAALNYVAIDNELQLTNYADSRSRGAGIWLDSSGWAIGTVTVTFDVLDYAVGGLDSESFFQAYYANGVDASSSVSFDVHGGGGEDPAIASTGSATIGTIGARNTITANATQVEFTFNFTGQDNIALVFHNMSSATDTTMPVYSVDNLTAIITPAPAGTLITIQ